MKVKCPKCQVLREVTDFWENGNTGKRFPHCSHCMNKHHKDNIDRRKARLDDMKKNSPLAYEKLVVSTLYSNAMKRAKKMGIPFTITKNDIPVTFTCPILEEEMEIHTGKQQDNSFSLDRIDSNLGYVPGNIAVISWKANYLKSRLTEEQIVRMALYVMGEL